MNIYNLDEKHYFKCFEDWSDLKIESGVNNDVWSKKMKDKRLEAKLMFDKSGIVVGLIQ